MFDILGVNEARFIAMQKQLKIPIIRLNGSAPSRIGTHGCSLPDR